MRLTTVLLIASLVQVSAAGFAQKISLNVSNVSLKNAIKAIRSQSGYNFVCTQEVFDNSRPVSINVKDVDFSQVIEQVFAAQPLTYQIENKTVVVKLKEEASFLDKLVTRFQAIDVTGRVVDEQGKPVAGATVRIKDGKGTAITNANGEFTLSRIDEKSLIIVSFIGYNLKEVQASDNLTRIQLEQSTSKLDEVQVQAYGVTSQRLGTGSVSSIKAKEIDQTPVSNPMLALQGRVTGVQIDQVSGYADGGVKVTIRGLNSLERGNQPLYIIDGIPYPSANLQNIIPATGKSSNNETTADGTESGNGSPLSFINPSDIESIDILKDAAATSIYGSRAGNGAIIITTKKGKAGDTKINFDVKQGFSKVGRHMDVLNTQQYLELRKRAYSNDGLSMPDFNTAPNRLNYDLTVWNQQQNTDWQKELIGGTGLFTNADLSISGGTQNLQYLVSGNFNRQTGVTPIKTPNQKGNLHLNLSTNSQNQKFKLSTSASYLYGNANYTPDLTAAALNLPPNAPALLNDGMLNWQSLTNGNSSWYNPLAYEYNPTTSDNRNLLSNLSVSYAITNDLEFKSSVGYNYLTTSEYMATKLLQLAPENRIIFGNDGRSAEQSSGSVGNFQYEPQLNFRKALKAGIVDITMGGSYLTTLSKQSSFYSYGFSSDQLVNDIHSGTTYGSSLPGLSNVYKYIGFFARVNYNISDRYIIEGSARRDGSSRFGDLSKFHTFGAISGSWIFSNEAFLNKNVEGFSFGKLRFSYGTSGNDQIRDYEYFSLYDSSTSTNPYLGTSALSPRGLANPYLQWEELKKFDMALSLGFLKNRILLEANYYSNYSQNHLTGYTLSVITGFDVITANSPSKINNSGWEFQLTGNLIKGSKFNWISNINLSLNRNKLIAFKDLESSVYHNRLVIGQPINIQKLYDYVGLNSQTGLYEFKTKSGDITPNPNFGFDDKLKLFSSLPDFNGGFLNQISYKNLELSFLFQFTSKKDLINGYRPGYFRSDVNSQRTVGNIPLFIYENSWKTQGDEAVYAKAGTSSTSEMNNLFYSASNGAIIDASFIRLKNVAVNWAIPSKICDKLKFSGAKIFVQGQNLLTLTPFRGLDPETPSGAIAYLPPLKTLVFGINFSL